MKRILIVYATAGEGHKKAALAIKSALDELTPRDIEVSIIDSVDYGSAFFRWSYLKGYIFMVNRISFLWGAGYYFTNNSYVDILVSKIRKLNDWLSSKKLRSYLMAMQPDVIVSTHFFASDIICNLNSRDMLRSHLITVITDYRFHSWWVSPCTDTYVVGSQCTRQDLLQWGINSGNIKVLGIPVGPAFSKPVDRKSILQKMNLRVEIPIVLVIGGGLGFGPIIGMVKIVDSLSKPVQIIVICGHNEGLVKELESLRPTFKNEIKVFGFVDNVHEYMGVSDLLISKCGGVTAAESLARGVPMVVVAPILGQETRNSDFFTSQGVAMRIDKLCELRETLEYLISYPEKLKEMRLAIEKIKKPAACYDIARLAIETCT